MDQPLISVIVPVYNAEAYLSKCVDSIRNQTYTNLEIILVDDGSPDHCGEMCDALAKKDARIRVFHKENGGQSSARNLGLDNMTGDYVGFVDSDDWIEPNMYEHLYDRMISQQAQISACGSQLDYADGTIRYFNLSYPNDREPKTYTTLEALRESLRNERITYSLCDKLYRADLFAELRLTEGMIYEDMELIPKCVEKAQRITYDPTPLYHYNLTQSSTIRGTFRPARFAEADVAKQVMTDYRVRYPALYDAAVAQYVTICLNLIHLSFSIPACRERRRAMIAELKQPLSPAVKSILSGNTRLKLKVLRLCPVLYELLMRLYDKTKHH